MSKGIEYSGVPSLRELRRTPGFPSKERLRKGAVAVIECVQEIPCNPCQDVCPHGAIKIGKPITNLPVLDEKKCTGCGLCIPVCPGLAIFVVDITFSSSKALVTVPYEYLPLLKVDSDVYALSRSGKILSKARVIRLKNPKKYDRTAVISIAVPKKFAQQVRNVRKAKR